MQKLLAQNRVLSQEVAETYRTVTQHVVGAASGRFAPRSPGMAAASGGRCRQVSVR